MIKKEKERRAMNTQEKANRAIRQSEKVGKNDTTCYKSK